MSDEQVTILIVDDDPGHAELIRRNFRRAGITNELVALADGQSALDFINAEGAFSDRQRKEHLLVLLDINMPGIDGVEVLRRIKADPATRKTPVMMLTTTDDPREVERCYQLGCSIYVTKPVEPVQFIEAIKRLGLFISVVRVPREEDLG